jgi:hypothetical protein
MPLKVIKNTLAQQPAADYTGPHKQIDLVTCWMPYLNNPTLNKLYKENISFTERWYLETRRLINDGMWDHPLLRSIVLDEQLKARLIKSTIIDGAAMRTVINDVTLPEYQMSACVNLKKLLKWCAFFVSLPDSHEILVALNGQSRD